MPAKDIWETERSFWLDGPSFYETHMLPEAQMVFPDPVGILKGRRILDGLGAGPRWASVEMEERSELVLGDTLVLAYRAAGQRQGAPTYRALCSSTYARQGANWKLIAHQQTPAG